MKKIYMSVMGSLTLILFSWASQAAAAMVSDAELSTVLVGGAVKRDCIAISGLDCTGFLCNADHKAKVCFIYTVCGDTVEPDPPPCANDTKAMKYKIVQYVRGTVRPCMEVDFVCAVRTEACWGAYGTGLPECGL